MACAIRSPQYDCRVFEDIATGVMNAWTLYMVNDVVVINKAAAVLGDTVVLYSNIPKVLVDCVTIASGNIAAFAEGCKVYYLANAVTNVANANVCGFVTVQPAVGDTTVEIHFDGTLRIVA